MMTQGAKGNSAVVAMRKYVHKMTIAKDVKENVQRIEEAVNKITKMLDEGDTEKLVDYLKVFSRVNAAISCDGVVRKCCHRKARISLHLTARFCFAGQASR